MYCSRVDDEDTPTPSQSSTPKLDELRAKLQMKRRQSWGYFALGLTASASSYALNILNPETETQILTSLTSSSPPISSIGTTSKPTVLEFWAPWCENCKAGAYNARRMKEKYGGKVNVILVDGDDRRNSWLVDRFR